ncbi:MAG: metal ABC transporter ATP-binding protein [Candidatus Aminicenantales bacterium]
MSKQEVQIAVKNVWFSYDKKPVLRDINLTIYAGDFLALLGSNGAGKTTLLKVMLGLLRPTKGEVFLFGTEMGSFKKWELLGYVPQTATHFDPLFPATVWEVVAMAMLARKKPWARFKDKEKEGVLAALRVVGMEELKHEPISRLSSGQQQRVFIARALVNQPRILFLDEPTTGIDAETQEQFYNLLYYLNQEKKITIILVTHDIGIVNRHVNKVACLQENLIYHGSHDEFCRSQVFKELVSRGNHVISHPH